MLQATVQVFIIKPSAMLKVHTYFLHTDIGMT